MNKHCEFGLVASQISELNKKIIYLSSGGHITPAINMLSEHTKKMIGLHRLVHVINCLQLADKLYLDGNEQEQELVIKRFVVLLIEMHDSVTRHEWSAIKKYISAPIWNAFLTRKYKVIPFFSKIVSQMSLFHFRLEDDSKKSVRLYEN